MPKYLDVSQGSVEWLQARLGLPTASAMHRIVTNTGRLSAQSKDFACLLVAERLLGRPLLGELENIDAIAAGKQMEPEAIAYYEMERGLDTTPVGFVTTDDGRIGCSPDRMVGENGLLEVKSPLPQTQIKYLIYGFNNEYNCQRQAQIMITERDWLDMEAYSRELPSVIIRYERDEAFIAKLREALDEFTDMLDEMTHKAISLGAVIKPLRPAESLSSTRAPSGEETIAMLDAALRMYAP